MRAEGFMDKWGLGDLLTNKVWELLTNEGRMIYWQIEQRDLLTNEGRGIYWQMRAEAFIDK